MLLPLDVSVHHCRYMYGFAALLSRMAKKGRELPPER